MAVALLLGGAATALAAEPESRPVALHTPQPFLAAPQRVPDLPLDRRVLTPLATPVPLSSPAPSALQTPLPSHPCSPLPTVQQPTSVRTRLPGSEASAFGNGVINLVLPVVGGQGGNPNVSFRLNQSPTSNEIEFQVQGRRLDPCDEAPPAPQPRPLPPQPAATPAPAAPTPAPRPRRYELARQLAGDIGLMAVSTIYPQGAINAGGGPVLQPTISGLFDLSEDFWLSGSGSYLRYTLVDQQVPNSLHTYNDFWGEAASGFYLDFGPARLAAGLGYWTRQVVVDNSLPPSLTTPLLSAFYQAYHGPQLPVRLYWGLAPGWRLDLEGYWLPYVMATGEPAAVALGTLSGAGGTLGVSWRLNPSMIVRGQYGYHSLSNAGAGYSYTAQGPSLRLSWRF